MLNTKFDNIDELDDCQSKDQYQMCQEQGLSETVTMQVLNDQARDHGRVPMLWDDSEYAGFSTVKPWMKVNQDYKTVNVASEQKDPNSVLNYYKTLIKLRKDPKYIEAFTYGEFVALEDPNDHTIAYLRKGKEHTLMELQTLVLLQLSLTLTRTAKSYYAPIRPVSYTHLTLPTNSRV